MPYSINSKPWERFGVPNLMEVFHCSTPLEIVEGDKPGNNYDTRADAAAVAREWYELEIKASELRAADFKKLLDGETAYQERVKAWRDSLATEEALRAAEGQGEESVMRKTFEFRWWVGEMRAGAHFALEKDQIERAKFDIVGFYIDDVARRGEWDEERARKVKEALKDTDAMGDDLMVQILRNGDVVVSPRVESPGS